MPSVRTSKDIQKQARIWRCRVEIFGLCVSRTDWDEIILGWYWWARLRTKLAAMRADFLTTRGPGVRWSMQPLTDFEALALQLKEPHLFDKFPTRKLPLEPRDDGQRAALPVPAMREVPTADAGESAEPVPRR